MSATQTTHPGLTESEAATRLRRDGPNALPDTERKSLLQLAARAAREPMLLLLAGAAGLYLFLGDAAEAAMLFLSLCVVVAITLVQEGRTERALDALRDLSSPRARVLRDGVARAVPGREVVVGDVVRVAEGDRVPADAVLFEGSCVSVDESLLTGESVPVTKQGAPDGDAAARVHSGTLVVSGRGLAEVTATGPRTELGKIGLALGAQREARTPLGREVDRVARGAAVLAVGVSLFLAFLRWRSTGDVVLALLAGITIAMSLLPEEIPVVLTVFLALGAGRMARHGVLTRRIAAVEALGGAHVLCVDKTGTLTQNRMAVRRLATNDAEVELSADEATATLPEPFHALLEHAILASPRDPFDPMERAFHALGERTLAGTEHLHPRRRQAREYALSAELLAVTHVWESDAHPGLVVATKGAPEAVMGLCHLDAGAIARWQAKVDALARDGLRVLAVARAVDRVERPPEKVHDLRFEMLGLAGLADPIRSDVPAAIALARRAGIRVLMITGDHAATAAAIADQAGLAPGDVLTGTEVESLSDGALAERLSGARAIARATPAHKLRIVRALAARGDVVGMTGDGVNDAPALRAADIGIAMGARGTDVAREAAGLVLVDDDFGSIVHAIRVGRRIWDNLRSAVHYIVAVHVPIAGTALIPALLGWDPVLVPAQIVFLELIIDPASSIAFELDPESDGLMERPPRARGTRLFAPTEVLRALAIGTVALVGVVGLLAFAAPLGLDGGTERTAAFVALVAGNLAILVTASGRGSRTARRPAALAIAAVALASLVLVATVAPIAQLFGLPAVGVGPLLLALAAGTGPVLGVSLVAQIVHELASRRSARP